MGEFFVEFRPKGGSLHRTTGCLARIAALKCQNALTDETVGAELTIAEREYFWNPGPAEHAAWNAHWFATPLPQRHSPEMAMPGWDFGSMVDALAGAEFDIKGVVSADGGYRLMFDPASYPFGGTGCLVALLECLNNEVVAVNDGTGLATYVQPRRWKFQR